jgi:phospholipid transport system substrate-binding protein
MGRHWKSIPQDKRTQFTEEFKKRLTISYSQNLDQYSGQEVVVTGSRREPDGDFTVQSYITDGDKKELAKVNYRIRGKPGQLKVIDFTVEGISLVSNYRAQFQELMSNGGIDNVLQVLRDKNARGEK